jgi:carboxypeptidase T
MAKGPRPPAASGCWTVFGRAGRRLPVAVLSLMLLATIGPAVANEGGEVVRVHGVAPHRIEELRQYGDVWGRDWEQDFVVMQVGPGQRAALERLGYPVETDADETGRLADFLAIDRAAWQLLGVGGIPGYPCYRTVDETHATLEQLVAAHPQHARLDLIGQSWQAVHNEAEGDILALVIGNQTSPHPRAPLVVMAAQHARELTTAETATRFAELLLEERDVDGDIAWLLDHREIHVIAQQNPDGRRRVEQGQTSWRKNHNANACGSGTFPGVDLNRNSPLFWGTFSSGDPCNQAFRGVAPSSEPETVAVEAYMEAVFDRQWPPDPGAPVPSDAEGIFLSLHSFGRMVLLPWEGLGGQNENNAPNHDQLTILGRKLGFHTDYAVARWQLLGPAGGTTVDFAYDEFGVAAYTLELGTTFLQPCGDFESTIWPAMREALLYTAKAAERPYQAPWGPDVLSLEAAFDPTADQIELGAVADGTRYFRGNVTEPPAQDPIFAIVGAVASFDVPPHLAAETFSLSLDGSGSVVSVSGAIPPPSALDQRRLLFVAATDAGGHTGPPTAVWVRGLGEAVVVVEPASLSLEVPSGETAVETLEVGNLGTVDLHWSIATDGPGNMSRLVVAATDLEGYFDIANWTLVNDPAGTNGSFSTDPGPPVELFVVGGNAGVGGVTDFQIEIPQDGEISFDWGYQSTDTGDWDRGGYAINGVFTQLADNASQVPYFNGSATVAVSEGDIFAFRVRTVDGQFGAGTFGVTTFRFFADLCGDLTEVPWLATYPTEGVTAPGSSVPVGVTADASGLGEGLYEVALCIATNDPARPMMAVPVELTVTPDPCPVGPSELVLEGITVTSPESHEACVSITVGPGVTVTSSGELTLTAGQKVVLRDGVVVESGGALTIEIDPDLLP